MSDLLNALTDARLTIERVLESGSPVPDILAVRCRSTAGGGGQASRVSSGSRSSMLPGPDRKIPNITV